jgi:hypothetical protein
MSNKLANMNRVSALMREGMSAKAAIKKAYPGWTDDQINQLASKLGAAKQATIIKESTVNKLEMYLIKQSSGAKALTGPVGKSEAKASLIAKLKEMLGTAAKKSEPARKAAKKGAKDLGEGFRGLGTLAASPREAGQALKQSLKDVGVGGTLKANKKELAALGVSTAGLGGAGYAAKKKLSSVDNQIFVSAFRQASGGLYNGFNKTATGALVPVATGSASKGALEAIKAWMRGAGKKATEGVGKAGEQISKGSKKIGDHITKHKKEYAIAGGAGLGGAAIGAGLS